MKYKIDAYFASLIITVFGALASLIIIHVAYANTFLITMGYVSIQQSLKK